MNHQHKMILAFVLIIVFMKSAGLNVVLLFKTSAITLMEGINSVNIISAFILFVIGTLIAQYIGKMVEKIVMLESSKTNAEIAYKAVFYSLFFLVILMVLSTAGVNTTNFIATAGILGIIIGFAAQKPVSNVISGFFLLGDKNFDIGDIIEIDGIRGVIMDIGLIFTKIKTWDNLYITLPNEKVASSKVINMSRYSRRRVNIPVTISYHSNIKKARKVAIGAIRKHEKVFKGKTPLVLVDKLDDHGVKLDIKVWIEPKEFWKTKAELTERIKDAFDENRIKIPFPQMDVHLKKR